MSLPLFCATTRLPRAWESLSPGGQRILREEIAAAKQPATRMRRARRALLGE